MNPTRIFSSGGGVQSTAVLVLSAQGVIDFPIHVFSNVGDRAESPTTIQYVREILKPYAAAHGIQWVEVCKRDKHGNPIDLLTKIETSQKSVPIPVRMAGSGAPGNRNCTVDWKIKPVAQHLNHLVPKEVRLAINKTVREQYTPLTPQEIKSLRLASYWDGKTDEAIQREIKKAIEFDLKSALYAERFPIFLGKGISTDEAQRAKSCTGFVHYQAAYPLIELKLNRADCEKIIKSAGLPPAPKSSCWFCPYKTKAGWQELRQSNPSLFWAAVALERLLHDRSIKLGRGGCFFTSTGTSRSLFIDDVTSEHFQGDLFHGFDDQECESGHCWT